jgi:hypothetical protein
MALLLADQSGDAATVDDVMKLVAKPDDAKALAEELAEKNPNKTGRDGDTDPSPSFQL